MYGFLKNQFSGFIHAPELWLPGCVFWVLESFVFLLFLQPSHSLSLTQKMGLLWGIVLFSHSALMGQYLTRSRMIWLFEAEQFSKMRFSVWVLDLFCLWLMYSMLFFLLLPFVCLLYGLSISESVFLYFLWLLSSPVCFLQMYLARLVSMFMQHGVLLSICVVLPWMIPELLLVVGCLNEVFMANVLSAHICFLLGFNMLLSYCLCCVIAVVLRICYQHALLA